MDPNSGEDEIILSSSPEDCGTPSKRLRLDSADSVLPESSESSCCSSQSNQEVLDPSGKDANTLESEEKQLEPSLEDSRDSLLDSPAAIAEMPKEIAEMALKNIELSTENAQLKERMIHEAEEHESAQKIVDRKIIELQDKMKSMSSSGDIDLQRIGIEKAKVMVKQLTSETTALLEENNRLLPVVARVDALEEKLKSLRRTAAVQKVAKEEQFRETAESLKQQVFALRVKCNELTVKVRKYLEPAENCHDVVQDQGSDKTPDGNKEVHPSSEGLVDDPDGTEGEMEQEKNPNDVIQDPSSEKMTPVANLQYESLSKAPGDDPNGTVEMEQEEKTRHDVLEDPNSGKMTPVANSEDQSLSKGPGDDPDSTVQMEQEEKKCQDVPEDSGSEKMTLDATDEDDSPPYEVVGDDPYGTMENGTDTEQEELNRQDVGQDPGSDKDTSDANSEEGSFPGESAADDTIGAVESAAEKKQVQQNRQDPRADNGTTDSESEEETLAEALERIRDEQKRRIKIGKHIYLVSHAKFNKINWNKEYKSEAINARGKQIYIYRCKKCRKESGNIHYLQDHIWCDHYGETFLCPHCKDHSEGFFFRVNLKYHMHRKHPGKCSCDK